MLNILENIDLTPLNTLHLKSTASYYVVLNKIQQLAEIREVISNFPKFFVLGGGSNLIIPTRYQGLVIHNELRGITMNTVGQEQIVTAMAGENWDEFVAYCITHGAFGLENLSLIPGTVGASPIQNIGAYGVEVKDFIKNVLVYDLQTAKLVNLSNSKCQFSYRNSILKNNSRFIVISVTFTLSAEANINVNYGDVAQKISSLTNPTPYDLRNIIIKIRQSKLPDPNELGNAGSFFHNPVISKKMAQNLCIQHPTLPIYPTPNPDKLKLSAGWLIDNLGLKGSRQGNVGIYQQHALIMVNYGGAHHSELLEFADWIQIQIKEHYDVQLNIEPIILE
ncbi:UDP-N-acetylmuramate dehydrogenase [Legionella cincinnatiensis]|uniref:UDP-N-acetylenolpyruvoylglucosamine reductase n=1 Tax=Legionella cincinnatiensis TaxID=28085 RepID=A0A378IIZ6_9GAMM|nr:UDP-N-acetylmuramate dehydrogenase [Legionella cincinnatiensis]KTC93885.1 UDP-N-acetylenolpyruvoylglucosamine reductase [Legionella cincinnatiensis]STX34910.1 UDP-N-acetylenolpyruvoylglucosamine reductase [Legionella cincinnatiensis]